MAKPIEIDGKFYRVRRGKLVLIPPQWLGCCTSNQTKNRRRKRAEQKRRNRRARGGRRFDHRPNDRSRT